MVPIPYRIVALKILVKYRFIYTSTDNGISVSLKPFYTLKMILKNDFRLAKILRVLKGYAN